MFKPITSTCAVIALMLLSGCGTNPVTQKKEIQFISESQEVDLGEKNYAPARQQQGGDYILDPELTAYLQSVGNKLAAASDRQLPYEFVLINDSMPNAWAMPGGKIAFNRGLLYELNSEAELAAVMSHEIVHAAARHGAQGMEQGMLMQGAVMAAGLASQNNNYANLIVGGAQLSSKLIATKFGRDDELEADLYGMRYMKKAGYDPRAAVTLQETFVRLSQNRQSNLIEGLFSSHPPSQARVDANKATLAQLGEGGEWGKEVYAKKVSKLKATQAAYKAYDDGVRALAKKDASTAAALAKQAIAAEPREARFQELLGDVAMAQNNPGEALNYYERAIKMQPDYFRPHVQTGIALKKLGRNAEAETHLNHSNALLPTAPSYYVLGQIAENRGDIDTALKNYEMAASSNSDVGKSSMADLMRIDLPRNPGKYLQTAPQADANGNLFAVVQNSTSAPVTKVQVRVIRLDPATNQPANQTQPLMIASTIGSNQRGQVQVPGARLTTPAELNLYRVVIERAELAQ